MLHLRQDIRDINRLRQVLLVLVEEGLGHYLIQAKLGSHLPFHHRSLANHISSMEEAAVHLRHACERLGPSFVKLGQLLSLRTDLVPLEIARELEKLQDNVPPFSFAEVETILQEEWGKPWKEVLQSLDKKPLAAASIAQVHRAILPSGEQVILKVQRPGIARILETDIDILFHLARSLEKHVSSSRNFRPEHIVREFAFWSKKELNFVEEAESALQLRAELQESKQVIIPRVFQKLCTRRIFVQEFVSGVKINDLAALKKKKINRQRLAMTYFVSLMEQALLHGFFHADPHPANIFVDRRGRIVFLDYGIMGHLTQSDRAKIIRFIQSLQEKDAEKSITHILSLARDISGAKIEDWKREALPLMEDVYRHDLRKSSLGKALYDLISLGAKYNIIFDPNHLLIAKTVYQAEGLGLQLYPQFQVREGFLQFARGTLQKETNLVKVLEKTAQKLWYEKYLLLEIPEKISALLTSEPGSSSPSSSSSSLQISQLRELEREWELESRRKNFLAVTAIFLVAGMFFWWGEGKPILGGMPLSTIFLTAAGLFFLLFWKTQRGESYGERS